MKHGVIIKKGLSDWQIIQQTDGYGEIFLEGEYYPFDPVVGIPGENIINNEFSEVNYPDDRFTVLVRIVREDDFSTVVSWTKAEITRDNKWQVKLAKIPAGGLYRLESCINDNNPQEIEWSMRGDMVHHFGVGDLYVIAGQSNSAGYGKDPAYDPAQPGIHIFKNSGKWDMASNPLNESTGSIHVNNMENSNPGSSPYLSFARMLKREINIPIGLLQTSKGGSALWEWEPCETGHLYKTMLEVIFSVTKNIKGILWYQGCSDVGANEFGTYYDRFKAFVETLRKDLNSPDLPFLTCQLNRHVTKDSDSLIDKGWANVRNAQRLAALEIPNVFVVPTIDLSLSDTIHISSGSNIILGERLGKIALKYIYGKDIMADAPDILSASKISEIKVKLKFKNVDTKLYDFDLPFDKSCFTFEDETGYIVFERYDINGDEIIFKFEKPIGNSMKVHYAWQRDPSGKLLKDWDTHLPLLSFYGVEIY